MLIISILLLIVMIIILKISMILEENKEEIWKIIDQLIKYDDSGDKNK